MHMELILEGREVSAGAIDEGVREPRKEARRRHFFSLCTLAKGTKAAARAKVVKACPMAKAAASMAARAAAARAKACKGVR